MPGASVTVSHLYEIPIVRTAASLSKTYGASGSYLRPEQRNGTSRQSRARAWSSASAARPRGVCKEHPMLDLICWPSASASSRCRSATPTPANGSEEAAMIFDYSLAALVTAGLLSTSPTRCCGPSGSERRTAMTLIGWIQIAPLLRDRRRAGEAARLVHDARLQRRAHVPVAGPAAGRGRALPARRRRREARAALARPTRSPCCSSTSAASSSSTR